MNSNDSMEGYISSYIRTIQTESECGMAILPNNIDGIVYNNVREPIWQQIFDNIGSRYISVREGLKRIK